MHAGGQGSHEYNSVLKELKVIDVKLFQEGDDLIQSRVRKVLERLGVRNLYPVDIIKHHIVPAFTSSSCTVSMILYLTYTTYSCF